MDFVICDCRFVHGEILAICFNTYSCSTLYSMVLRRQWKLRGSVERCAETKRSCERGGKYFAIASVSMLFSTRRYYALTVDNDRSTRG